MASEEERQKILAEYYASAGKDDDEDEEDEAEFSEEESDEDEGGYDDSDSDAGDTTVVTLTGNCTLAKEGDDGKSYKYVYKGTWDDGKYKFKYKSKMCTNKSGATDDELLKMPTPVGSNGKTDDNNNNQSTLLFDGFFYTAPDSDGGTSSKVKERDMEISFFADGRVEGRGANDFGAFYLEGQYDGKAHSLTLEKGYGNPKKRRKSDDDDGDGGDAKKAKSGGDGDDDDEEEEFEF
uniref:Uncharacterized protein n=1 Tax=Leptocylindrus danicus TaxID=163516 RepID=A0A7S2L6T3_9STRA|mmetsp:Transcript_32719/g.47342  ORF Transcript_32719/g.47342 Transcript_32719/m.47342 type:complete len:236 (+) Transcript_32719:1619-2326(+)|eukprot:CAMPEP_0116024812 /NCGR_PEP_ID=MMETSP0321-20121206/12591_1 /TAXON_ID=163516 /ORGANISM="Leptocylindrus danicus var. danicus, Strain B650" /LENGTH=235 /DNA_ID=CAMNT_0003496717 /DNA_START=1686 /DNA_END=2393 /DNA_ORIENTATION=+